MKYVIEISDMEGKSCRIKLSLPFIKFLTDLENSTWNVMDEGCLKYRSGGCNVSKEAWTLKGNLQICFAKAYGILLNDFVDNVDCANDSGVGELLQPMALGLKPGRIGWTLLS